MQHREFDSTGFDLLLARHVYTTMWGNRSGTCNPNLRRRYPNAIAPTRFRRLLVPMKSYHLLEQHNYPKRMTRYSK